MSYPYQTTGPDGAVAAPAPAAWSLPSAGEIAIWVYAIPLALLLAAMLIAVVRLGAMHRRANVLVEKVFAWPGVGSYAVEALIASDYAPIQGFVLTMAIMYVLLNLMIDMLYGVIDPRVRLEG